MPFVELVEHTPFSYAINPGKSVLDLIHIACKAFAKISDLWLPGQKTWNVRLINDLFEQPTASTILATHIVYDDCRDFLCWDLTPSGKCTSKITYKLCLQ